MGSEEIMIPKNLKHHQPWVCLGVCNLIHEWTLVRGQPAWDPLSWMPRSPVLLSLIPPPETWN